MTLPPGQHRIDRFPRFGTHLHLPPPSVPAAPALEIRGAAGEVTSLPLAELAAMPRTELTADFHCAAGWTATGLRWEGVAFATFYREVLEPLARQPITHLVFGGLDGFEALVRLEDALADDVLLAEHLDGRPLDGDHGAPLRLVIPRHYGYMNVKHLSRIELHVAEPRRRLGAPSVLARVALRASPFMRHSRARVWEEERHPVLPARVLRPMYRLVSPLFEWLSARGSRRDA